MPEPGSKSYDTRRARRRKDAEKSGVPDKHADDEADEELQEEENWRSTGPRTARGYGPKGERPESGG